MSKVPDTRDRYEAQWVWGGFFALKANVTMPDAAQATLTLGLHPYGGVISTAHVTYTVTHTRMKSADRDVARYVTGGIYKDMPSVHLSDFERGREYFLCFAERTGWLESRLVLLENGGPVGEYTVSPSRCSASVRDVATPMVLLSLLIAMFGFGEGE
jgi:hypothetical protein